ncbi:MAG TPA: class I SAM-dependent methyltransferase, partial [Gemmatimonadales bacterium]|nr:class I SAM-dependent methyltransferase [Gemmatimonadales bacterium]
MGEGNLTLPPCGPPLPLHRRSANGGDGEGGGRGEGEVYSAYAPHYDPQGQGQWSLALIDFTLTTLLPRYRRRPRTALDLACGTGTAVLALARAGLATIGLDRSRAMLAIARDKATRASVPCHFVRADLRAFAFARPFDLITCCYDSLNYLADPTDLRAAFAQTRAALAPGGLFVCDL